MPTILSVSQDASLRSTRSALLRLTGAHVETSNAAEAHLLLTTRRFDVIVLCYTIATDQATELAALARQEDSRARVLQLIAGNWCESVLALADASVPPEPGILVARVAIMLDQSRPSEPQRIP